MDFGNDQLLNGRLRDLVVSPDGKKIYLTNNGGADRDKITVYTYAGPEPEPGVRIYPNPFKHELNVRCDQGLAEIFIYNYLGQLVKHAAPGATVWSTNELAGGLYTIVVRSGDGRVVCRKVFGSRNLAVTFSTFVKENRSR